ncbi:capsule assembly Wzi family protein [Spirosoma daeguense]
MAYAIRLLPFLLLTISCFAQTTKPLRYRSEAGGYFSVPSSTPFWLRANQYGIVPQEKTFLTLRHAMRVDYHDLPQNRLDSLRAANRRIDWGWGAEAVLNAGTSYNVVIPEAYVKVKFGRNLEAWAGRRREVIGLVDSTLSSGSYAWSTNALPMLKIQLATPDYFPRNALFGFKGMYAHGWFEEDRFVKNVLLHQKALYGRFGKPNWRLKLYGGFNHQAMWGGNTESLPGSVIKNNQLPNRFSDYIDVITGTTLGNRTNVDTTRISRFDRENRIGNHLGSIDLGFEYRTRSFSVFAYRQNVYEDGSLFYLINISDGLNGLRIRNLRSARPGGFQIQDVLLEFLFTQSQGGELFLDKTGQQGRDNYFNHSQYRDGWSRYGLTMGTPFISPSTDSNVELPRYGFTNNNRVSVFHVGLSGQIVDFLKFQIKASYSQNLGTYEVPFPRAVQQFSSILSMSAPLPIFQGITANISIANDTGNLYQNNTGFFIGIRKEGQSRRRDLPEQ